MYPQNAYNLIAEIDPGKLEALRKALEVINNDVETNKYFPFLNIRSIHFARFVILERNSDSKEKYPVYLAFESNYDGTLDDHLKDIVANTKANTGFDKVFGACKKFPDKQTNTDQDRMSFLKTDSLYHPYFYRGTWGRTVDQIKDEDQTRTDIQDYLDKNPKLRAKTEREIYQELKDKIKPSAHQTEHPPKPLRLLVLLPVILYLLWTVGYSLYYVFALLICFHLPFVLSPIHHWITLGIAVLLLTLSGVIYGLLRYKEATDVPLDKLYDPNPETGSLRNKEDRIVQNQLTHLVELKEGIFRRCLLKAVLFIVEQLGIYYFNRGQLGGIPSIHFARWIIIDNGKRLLFYSNFDGSWENYLGDFIDRAAVGLTAVWSNTKLFPKSKNLVMEGATDEQKFKSWTRMHQVQTQVWYSAYKTLTVENINNNTAISEGLKKELTDKEIKEWLLKL